LFGSSCKRTKSFGNAKVGRYMDVAENEVDMKNVLLKLPADSRNYGTVKGSAR
jgi:hypothetical protein